MFTDRVVLSLAEIEGIIGNNLPVNATRGVEYWNNAKERPWTLVGWNVESVDMNNRKVTFVRVAKPQLKPKKKEKKQTEFFKRPLRFPKSKRPFKPSKTKIAHVQARLRNIERRNMANQLQQGKSAPKKAYEKRLFKPQAKPSKTSG